MASIKFQGNPAQSSGGDVLTWTYSDEYRLENVVFKDIRVEVTRSTVNLYANTWSENLDQVVTLKSRITWENLTDDAELKLSENKLAHDLHLEPINFDTGAPNKIAEGVGYPRAIASNSPERKQIFELMRDGDIRPALHIDVSPTSHIREHRVFQIIKAQQPSNPRAIKDDIIRDGDQFRIGAHWSAWWGIRRHYSVFASDAPLDGHIFFVRKHPTSPSPGADLQINDIINIRSTETGTRRGEDWIAPHNDKKSALKITHEVDKAIELEIHRTSYSISHPDSFIHSGDFVSFTLSNGEEVYMRDTREVGSRRF